MSVMQGSNEKTAPASMADAASRVRRAYSPPTLTEWGCVDELTRGTGRRGTDTPFVGYRFAE
jgi:hypothetical protein